MPFDIFTAGAICDELTPLVVSARIDKLIQTSELAVAMRVWSRIWSGSIVMSADARHARLYATESKLAKGTETPPPFLMLLRKYCTGGRITTITQSHLDRIIHLDISGPEHGDVSLIVEIMGNRSNVILTGTDSVILGAMKLIGAHQSRSRRILPHVRYEPPPDQPRSPAFGGGDKLDPLSEDDRPKIQAALGRAPAELTARDGLVGLVRGCSPALARVLVHRVAGANADAGNVTISSMAASAWMNAIGEQYSLFASRQWNPIVIRKDGVATDYRAYDQPPAPGSEPATGMSAAIETVSEGMESVDALQDSRRRVQTGLSRRAAEIQARAASLQRGMENARDAEKLLESGNLILGFQYQIEPSQTLLEIPEMEARIVLDPELGPVENAEKYFRRYRKARDGAKLIPQLLTRAKTDADFVEELSTYVDLAESPADLKRIEEELLSRFSSKASASTSKKKARPPAVGKVYSVDLPGGFRILAGRSARQNEEITFRLAGRGDLWLHVRGAPGSHVVLRGATASRPGEGSEAEQGAVQAAASVAAYYSKARQERAVDVIVALVRDVHRLPGGAPGQVTVRNEWTVRAVPELPASEFASRSNS